MIPLSFVDFWELFLGACHYLSRALVWLADFISRVCPTLIPTHGLCPASKAMLVWQHTVSCFSDNSGMSVSRGSLVKQGEIEEEGVYYKAVMKAVETQDLQSVSWIPWG